jgi:predicted amino acid racemase
MAYLEINLKKILQNAKRIKKLMDSKNMSLIGITKVVLGNPSIAKTLIDAGIEYLGDSRIENIIRMYNAGINAKFVLIRNPSLSELNLVVKYADISLNSEFISIERLSNEAIHQNKIHGIIIMVEMGDLREGVMPDQLEDLIRKVLNLKNIELVGIGTNFKCFAGVIPDERNMKEFSDLVKRVQNKFGKKFNIISGGNSANYNWLISNIDKGAINNLRFGTSILLGVEGINEDPIPDLHQDAFTLVAEIVEMKEKPLYPKGTFQTNAFGEPSIFKDKTKFPNIDGSRNQALLNAGRQDINEKSLIPEDNIEILSATSDYIIVDLKDNSFKIGQELRFNLKYEGVLGAMTSPYISKVFI